MTDFTTTMKLIQDWSVKRHQLEAAKEAERLAREAVVATCFAAEQANSAEGAHYFALSQGYRLKGEFGVNYNVSKSALPETLLALAAMGEAGDHAGNTVFRYKPELNVAPYKTLMPSLKKVVDTCITTTPAMVKLTIVEPKAGK